MPADKRATTLLAMLPGGLDTALGLVAALPSEELPPTLAAIESAHASEILSAETIAAMKADREFAFSASVYLAATTLPSHKFAKRAELLWSLLPKHLLAALATLNTMSGNQKEETLEAMADEADEEKTEILELIDTVQNLPALQADERAQALLAMLPKHLLIAVDLLDRWSFEARTDTLQAMTDGERALFKRPPPPIPPPGRCVLVKPCHLEYRAEPPTQKEVDEEAAAKAAAAVHKPKPPKARKGAHPLARQKGVEKKKTKPAKAEVPAPAAAEEVQEEDLLDSDTARLRVAWTTITPSDIVAYQVPHPLGSAVVLHDDVLHVDMLHIVVLYDDELCTACCSLC